MLLGFYTVSSFIGDIEAMQIQQNAEARVAVNASQSVRAHANQNQQLSAQRGQPMGPRRFPRRRMVRTSQATIKPKTFPPTPEDQEITIQPEYEDMETTTVTQFPTFARGNFNNHAVVEKKRDPLMTQTDPRALASWAEAKKKHQKQHNQPKKGKAHGHGHSQVDQGISAVIDVEIPDVVPEVVDGPLGIINNNPVNGLLGGGLLGGLG